MKVSLYNKFHNKEAVVSIKKSFCVKSETKACDPLAMLDYEVYSNGNEKKYAIRKLKEIKDKLCGSDSCQCRTTYDPEHSIN